MMGLNLKESDVNINKVLDDASNKIIKDFSGKDNLRKVRVMDNMVVFMGVAGGTGTSTVAANVAYEVSKRGLNVLLVDLNMMYPIQHSLFGVKQELEKKDLLTFILGKNSIGESIENLGNISLLYPNNRYLMDYINCDTSACSRTLIEGIKGVRHLFDLIIFDCPMALEHDVINSVLYNSDMIYTVWDEGISCVANIDRLKKNMQVTGVETQSKLKVVFNKKTSVYYTKYIFEQLGLTVLETLPFDPAVIECNLRGELFCEKGASLTKTATQFVNGISLLADKVLEIGGYGK